MPADVIQSALGSAERLGRDVADVPVTVIAHALGVSRSTLLRQLGGSRRALDDAVRDSGVDPGGRPPVRLRAVAAAAALISSRGVGAATFEAVAAKADCSVHSLYAVFGGRDALLEAVYDRYIPTVDLAAATAGSPELNETVRTIYRSLAEVLNREPRVLMAVLAAALARPTEPAGQVLADYGALRSLADALSWLENEVADGRIRDIPRPLLLQQLLSPIVVHCMMRRELAAVPQATVPGVDESCDIFADAFVRAVAL
ncbi:MAG: TetR family transcriptional regulator [Mycobacterium sp.]|uniref:TetR/AcrR family transcriptional regulator n=1 Tax=Mycobacterium sp. TaxID=1785 RepID=UPI003CC676DA